jgi:protein-L-isoaspartate(D-aspartate) O-methyltransferase
MDPAALRESLVQHLLDEGYLRGEPAARAMRAVPRHRFVPASPEAAYEDRPLDIGQGQTISAPHMVAMMVDALDLAPGMRVLEVGTGSGYHAAVVAECVGPGGRVVSVERFAELAAPARRRLRDAGYEALVEVVVGDGSEGWPAQAPYDRVYVTCAAPGVPPPLLEQLAPGGKLLLPLGDRQGQELTLVERTPEGRSERRLGGCVFVPLVGRFGFQAATPSWN